MRFIHALSYKGADFLMKQLNENHEKRRVYYFGFQIVIGGIVKGLLLLLLALITGTLLPSITIVLIFSSLRTIAGGYHMDSYGKCISVSIGLFIIAAVISRYTYHVWNIYAMLTFILLTFSFAFISILKWAPSDNPNRPITKEDEIKKFKRLSLLYIFIWLLAVSIALYLKLDMYVLAGCFGVILEVFSITPFGHRFFDFVKNGINVVKS
ncbi:MAG: accessory gene regulator ArgB-like protein [Bacillota bacterium]